MQFGLFIVLNGILLVRPEEIVPEIGGARLYFIVIGLCTITTFPRLLIQLSPRSLSDRPITVCILGLLLAMALSKIIQGQFDVINIEVADFAKTVLYVLLMMAVIDRPSRMLTFMGWLVAFVIALSVLGLLQVNGLVDIESIRPIMHTEFDAETGQSTVMPRMCSSGIFNDPNDFCLILTTGSMCCLCRSSFAPPGPLRVLWLCPMGLFFYAIVMTYSRGGLLGFLGAISGFLYARFGWKKCLPLILIIAPGIVVVLGGRQANLGTESGDTAQERIQLWSQGLSIMMGGSISKITGIGVGEYGKQVGMVAHNSFVHAYVEMGLLGGSLFLGAFYLAFWGPCRFKIDGTLHDHPRLLRMQPFIVGMVVGYAFGIYSVSRNYVLPTYLILSISAAFLDMSRA